MSVAVTGVINYERLSAHHHRYDVPAEMTRKWKLQLRSRPLLDSLSPQWNVIYGNLATCKKVPTSIELDPINPGSNFISGTRIGSLYGTRCQAVIGALSGRPLGAAVFWNDALSSARSQLISLVCFCALPSMMEDVRQVCACVYVCMYAYNNNNILYSALYNWTKITLKHCVLTYM